MSVIQKTDPAAYKILRSEVERQKDGIELIASENYVSPSVLEAIGSVFTNKYSEGYPGKRYYAGNEVVDSAETLAIDRAKELFDAEHVNVQPLSGSPANMAVYFALLKPGDKILGLKLDHGGHLSHGHPVNFSGMMFDFVQYTCDKDTGVINMDEVHEIALKEKPKMIVAGFSAYSRDMEWQRFQEIADEIGALTFGDIAHVAGLMAGKQIDNPVPIFDVVTTTTHKTLRGPRGGMIMCKEKHAKAIDRAVFPGIQGGPHDNLTFAKAVAFGEALTAEFQEYTAQIIKNAKVMADELMDREFKVVSDGTDNHLMVVDLRSKGKTGKEITDALDKAGISVSMSTVPFDPNPPMKPSGVRLGTPAITSRGMMEEEVKKICQWVSDVVDNHEDEKFLLNLRKEVAEFCKEFPVPGTDLVVKEG
jgi:glycine hydroxymethyltransferase